jgi:hypothetical protein
MSPLLVRNSEVRESASNAAAEHGPSGAARSYLNRLRCMTPAEISYRVVHKLRTWVEPWLDQESDRYEAPTLGRDARPWVHLDARVDGAPYLAAADRVLSDKHDLLALRGVELGAPPHWNRDPKTGVRSSHVPGMRLNCRDRRLVGDVGTCGSRIGTCIWSLAAGLPIHRRPPVLGRDSAAHRELARGLPLLNRSELGQRTRARGPVDHWSRSPGSSRGRRLDCSATRPTSYAALARIRPNRTAVSCAVISRGIRRPSIGWSAKLPVFIRRSLGRNWPDSDGWALDAAAVLERRSRNRTSRDGVNREQSVGCQQLELDLLLFT